MGAGEQYAPGPPSTRAKPSAAAKVALAPPGGSNNSKFGAVVQTRRHRRASAMTWALLITGTASKSKAVEGLAGRQPGFGEVAFEPARAALGNLVFGQCCQEASGRPAFLVGLSGKRSPHQFYWRAARRGATRCGPRRRDRSFSCCITSWTVLELVIKMQRRRLDVMSGMAVG